LGISIQRPAPWRSPFLIHPEDFVRPCRARWFALPAFLALTAFFVSPVLAAGDCSKSAWQPILVGGSSGTSINNGFAVLVKNNSGSIVPGATVKLRLNPLGSSTLRAYTGQNVGVTVNCTTGELSKVTDATGIVRFDLQMGGFDNDGNIEIAIDGTSCQDPVRLIRGRSTDIDGLDGTTGIGDLSLFAVGFLAPEYLAGPHLDFNKDGLPANLADLSIFVSEFLNSSPSNYCQ
jgi:hypothetical protein